MIEFITKALEGSDFLKGGVLLMMGGGLLGIFYRIWGYISRIIRFVFFTSFSVESNTALFDDIQFWIYNQEYIKKYCSRFKVKAHHTDDDDNSHSINLLLPDYGMHYLFLKGRPATIIYSRIENNHYGDSFIINISILKVFNKNKFVNSILKDAKSLKSDIEYQNTHIYSQQCGNWQQVSSKRIKVTTPILKNENDYNNLLKYIEKFYQNEELYKSRGINFKRGILLSGPPGNGKTSCIVSLAQDLKKHIAILNLGDAGLTSQGFLSFLSYLPKDSILILEDIDAIECTKDRIEQKDIEQKPKKNRLDNTLDLSTILNTLDGIFTPHGLVFILTSNYPEKLDKALVRPGRIDLHKELDNANEYQCRTIFQRFRGKDILEEDRFVNENLGKSMAHLESQLLKYL